MPADQSGEQTASCGFLRWIWGKLTGGTGNLDRDKESDWLEFCDFKLYSGRVQIVDPSYLPGADGCIVELPPGVYHLQTKTMAYGSDERVSRLRAVRPGVSATLGVQIGEAGCDTAKIGICDEEGFGRACEELGDDVEEAFLTAPDDVEGDLWGVVVLDKAGGAVMPFVDSGFGDGTYPVRELVAEGSRVGFEIVFIESGTPYMFSR
jgi:hypothetical protein